MQIDAEEVPEVVVAAWKSWIDRLSPTVVKKLAAGRPSVMHGFRPTAIDVTVARTRLKAALVQSSELPTDLRAELTATCLASSLLTVLSEVALELTAAPLAALFGVSETAASMLLDERLLVRDRGRNLLAEWDGAEPTQAEREAARSELVAQIGPFLSHMRELIPPQGDGSGSDGATRIGQVAKSAPVRPPRPQREAELVKALYGKRKDLSRLTRENGALTSQLSKALSDAKAAKAEHATAQERLAAAQSQLGTLTSELDTQVSRAVQARLDDRLFPWLRPAEAIAAAAQALKVTRPGAASDGGEVTPEEDSEPVRAAQRLLQRQAEVDRQFGLRRALRAERERCDTLRGRLREAQAESIRPLGDLAAGIQALEARIRQIDATLGEGQSVQPVQQSPALRRLELALAAADSLDAVSALRRGLIASEPLGLLDEEELAQAYRHLGQASSRIYARAGLGRGWTVDGRDLTGLPLYAVQSRLAQGMACTVIVDGHNVLWKVPVLFRPHYEQGQPGGQARRALEAALTVLAKRYPSLTIHLWFDGGVMQDLVLEPNLRVHFSGGVGANRADRQMLAYLTHMSATGTNEVRAVVTADGEVAASAQASGALTMTPQELAIWMG